MHQNPVWVSGWARRPIEERIKRLRGDKWSSYPGCIGKVKPWEFVDEQPVLAS